MINYTTTDYNIINHQPFGNDMMFMKHHYGEVEEDMFEKETTKKSIKYYSTQGIMTTSVNRMDMHRERIQKKRRQTKAQNWVVEFQNEKFNGKRKPVLKNYEQYQIDMQKRKEKQNMMSDKNEKTPKQHKKRHQRRLNEKQQMEDLPQYTQQHDMRRHQHQQHQHHQTYECSPQNSPMNQTQSP
eukprot:CAMPEP_0117430468 /NCGR_PEP_ID=MMETSP0758-20121206/10007_1 /TAXON_ID=63605 /ORGANISM="Percolomonas cosmopolitus, Strain AE-1 (ATCC 50343)" /LENGTH=183 /DNA_ID=CAMNT_0005218517 /DNA_START=59 /DNA_END=607 /DNA_ORIENTATION=+